MAFDQHEARRITRAAEEYMREHQPPGYHPTPEENQAFRKLRTRRSQATFQEDLEAMREANTALVVRTLESYARHNAELDEHGDGPTNTETGLHRAERPRHRDHPG